MKPSRSTPRESSWTGSYGVSWETTPASRRQPVAAPHRHPHTVAHMRRLASYPNYFQCRALTIKRAPVAARRCAVDQANTKCKRARVLLAPMRRFCHAHRLCLNPSSLAFQVVETDPKADPFQGLLADIGWNLPGPACASNFAQHAEHCCVGLATFASFPALVRWCAPSRCLDTHWRACRACTLDFRTSRL
jgi:hypothetical protein